MPNTPSALTLQPARVASIDIFRGLVILSMVFVNDVAGVKNAPWYLEHMPTDADAMSFADLVFPAFLFIVGLSIPFALGIREQRGERPPVIAGHVLLRTISLLIVGVFMVNIHDYAAPAGGLSRHWWQLLFYTSVLLTWNQYPRTWRIAGWILRGAGIALLVYLASTYHAVIDGHATWMRTQWWGILGLIGWAYLVGCCVYGIFRRHIEAVVGMVALLTLLFVAKQTGTFEHYIPWLSQYLDLGSQIGGHGSLVCAGLAVGLLFFPASPAATAPARIRWMLTFAVGLAVAGFWMRPLYGISKNLATPAWCLLCSAICCTVYALLYWFVDVRGIARWGALVRPAGSNPLLAYILPDILYSLFAITGFHWTLLHPQASTAPLGLVRSAVFTLAILGFTALLTRTKIRLRL